MVLSAVVGWSAREKTPSFLNVYNQWRVHLDSRYRVRRLRRAIAPKCEPNMSLTSVDFDQVCREALEHGGDLPITVRDRVIEDLRLRFEHPGEYVAYLDRYETRKCLSRGR
jgi:hypothetical protein